MKGYIVTATRKKCGLSNYFGQILVIFVFFPNYNPRIVILKLLYYVERPNLPEMYALMLTPILGFLKNNLVAMETKLHSNGIVNL